MSDVPFKPLKLTPGLRAIAERVARHGPLLELTVTGSGGRSRDQLAKLIRAGYVRRVDHPTVKTGRYPADALEITEAGAAALKGDPS